MLQAFRRIHKRVPASFVKTNAIWLNEAGEVRPFAFTVRAHSDLSSQSVCAVWTSHRLPTHCFGILLVYSVAASQSHVMRKRPSQAADLGNPRTTANTTLLQTGQL